MRKAPLPKPSSDNKQIQAYEEAVKKGLKAYHITQNGQGWEVKHINAKKPTKKFETQREAIEYGKEKAKNNKTSLYIHSQNGNIRQRHSYS